MRKSCAEKSLQRKSSRIVYRLKQLGNFSKHSKKKMSYVNELRTRSLKANK